MKVLKVMPTRLGIGEAYITQSASDPTVKHITFTAEAGAVCSCKGFTTHNYCWHVRVILEGKADV